MLLSKSARLCTVAAVLVVGGLALAPLALHAEIIEAVLVKVNGEIISKTDLEARQVAVLRQRNPNMSDAELKKAVAEATPQIIVDAVDELLLLQRGHELGYRLTDDRFTQILDNIKKENKIETQDQLNAALKAENMTMAELRKNIERRMIVDQVQQNEVMSHINVTEAEARNYYEGHRNEFTTPASMMLREILVSVPKDARGVNAAREEEAKAKADRLRERVVAGESFEKVVAEASDAPTKANGGLIGPISKTDLDPSLRTIFEPLKSGDVTPVIRTASGFQVFKIESLTESQVLPFDQAREQIADKVANSKRMGEFVRYMQKLRAQAVIDWKNPELKKMFDQRIAEEAAEAAKGNPGR